jgi:drug/metabolite transporter, DME family
VQMGIGLALFTIGARLIPAAEVALITLLEVVLGPLWVWLFLSEEAGAATLVGGAIVIVAVALQVVGEVGGRIGDAQPPPP